MKSAAFLPGALPRLLLGVLAALAALPSRAVDGSAAAPQSPPAEIQPARGSQQGPYRFHAGDEIEVSVNPQKEYDCSGIILPDGMLYLKNIGGIKAQGLTIPELAER